MAKTCAPTRGSVLPRELALRANNICLPFVRMVLLLWLIPGFLPGDDDGRETIMSASGASYVRPIDFASLQNALEELPRRDAALVRLYLDGAQRSVLTIEDGASTSRGPEHWRNLAERAHGAAALGVVAADWPENLRERCRRESAAFLREFLDGYRKDPFLGNKPLPGDDHAWQASWWVGEMGVASWFLWDQLSADVREGVAEMIVFHANRIAARTPGARIERDTEAETVAWNSTILTLAVNMMPGHPQNAQWGEAAKRYAYTIFGTSRDLQDDTPGDDERPISAWVAGANVHDDFSLENHDRFHIDYVFACYRFIIQGAALYRLAGNPVPAAFSHHTLDMYERVLLQCTNGSGFAVYVSDNDWKRYHAWTESSAVHGYIALTQRSPLASALEEESLKISTSIWKEFPKDFSYDNPYVCGRAWTPRISDIVLLHLLLPPLPDPMPVAQAKQSLQGARQKHDVNLLTHYSVEGSFRSYYWGPGPIVRHIEPKDGGWMMLPSASNYNTIIDGESVPGANAEVYTKKGSDWFWVLRRDTRGAFEAFISLPGEMVISMHGLPASLLAGARTLDNLANVEKPHRAFRIYFDGGSAGYRYGQEDWSRTDGGAVLDLKTHWVNVDDEIGYAVMDLSQGTSTETVSPAANRSKMMLPRAGARDSLSLYHVENPDLNQRYIIVALPNHTHRQTKAMASEIAGCSADGIITCLAPPYFVWANYSDEEKSPSLPESVDMEKPVLSSPKSIGILRMDDKGKVWRMVE